MTRALLNNSIFAAGLVLQCSLLVLLFVRGLSRRLPVFTLLLVFYTLRAATFFTLAGHLAPAAYASLYNTLSLVDILLQFCVAIAIAIEFLPATSGWTSLRGFLLLFLLAACSWAATLAVTGLLPVNAPVPPDRLQTFDSLTMILLGIWALSRPVPALQRRLTLGFAFFGAVSLLTTAARTVAAIHRDAYLFAQWSYTLSGAYLLVVAYWIAVLKPDASNQIHSQAN